MDFNRIQTTPLSLDALLAGTESPECGALTVFSGTVRDHHEGRSVLRLKYTSHVPLAERMIREIERATCAKFDVPLCRVVHRIGELGIGESAILAIVRSGHRAEAFAALKYLVDQVKHRVPIWKEEFYADGSSAFVTGCCIADDADDASHAGDHDHAHHHHAAHTHAHTEA
ncbi:molybdenum cofactor biosynthesis protein MoaE [Sinimarinibacterium sp. CAU 1509]|uniref:molybdenum cofactor biosynthesis protein MoaE n=1 Tax=Sinimarinibacterium sp. CAU 1509 TaxID=2562283 RepID=UPI0010AC460E|nr:molybdenum cofactor biosynthesis protein MoaE [Sinimarinibacterium sp. CAU 1509]TJY58180.1 molybdenum cofactor biosynthesis protein MoaE [Sinimarinibacterium sp. CAU 1509]